MRNPTFSEVSIVGMHFRERDGIPAKEIVANLVPPCELELEREPDNRFDAFAIKVFSPASNPHGRQHIGYVEATVACYLAPHMDDGAVYKCVVTEKVERKNNLYPVAEISPADAD